MEDKILEKLKKKLPDVQKNIPLKNHTTFKIGGPAKYFFIAKSKEDLLCAVKIAKELKLPVFILGGGSNVLVLDKGFNGLVVKIEILGCKAEEDKIFSFAGTTLYDLADCAAENSFSGFEWASGIPGATVGGAVYGHAQAFNEKVSDWIESIEALDIKNLKTKFFSKEQCKFSLKNSIFKKRKNLIIISATFTPKKGNKEEIKGRMNKFMSYRKNSHPVTFPSAGSVFVNPEKRGKVIRAGELIEKAGLKGKKIGGAQISLQHANFIINLGNAKAKDVLALIKLVQKKVKKTSDVSLETEVQIL